MIMTARIDFDKKEIHFGDDANLHDFATHLHLYFPEDIWGDFKIILHEGRDRQAWEEDNRPPISDDWDDEGYRY